MRLQNPFLNEIPPQPISVATPNQDVYNPGPGLPQATIPTYNYSAPPPPPNFLNNKDKFSRDLKGSAGSQNTPFFCDRCDRSFRSRELLDAHISEHIPCGIEGCPFMAHPKIVEVHYQMQHRTGMASMIMNVTSPEDILKWREERKKRFPSASNIARRMAEQKEKLDRGEVLFEPKNRFEKKGKRNQRDRNGNGNRTEKRQDMTPSKVVPNLAKKEDVSSQGGSVSNSKTKCSLPSEAKVLSDGEIDSETEAKCQPPPNALSSFMASYNSDSEDEVEEAPALKKIKVDPVVEENPEGKDKRTINQKNRRKKKTNNPENSAEKDHGSKKSEVPALPIHRKRLTLLQKLLEKEIIHERNVVLQCVHYIVQQNFFGIGQKINKEVHTATNQPYNTLSRCSYFI